MKKACCVILSCLILSGCGYQYERSRDRDEAKTLQQKRDVLLKWSPLEIKQRSDNSPYNANDARRRYLEHGEESDSFLEGLVSACFTSKSDVCAYNYYVDADNKYWSELKKEQTKIADSYSNQLVDERLKKVAVTKGDLFHCKVSLFPGVKNTDSGLKATVKDDVSSFNIEFSNGFKLKSPILKVTEPSSGTRTGGASSDGMVFMASFDGSQYSIDIYERMTMTQILGWRYIASTQLNEFSNRINLFDCKK